MPASDHRRVVVHAGGANVDLVLPATIAIADLMPSIVDILGGPEPGAPRYRLSCPGAAPMPNSTTLAQYGIRDGAILVVSQQHPTPAAPRFDDVAEAVSAALNRASRPARPTRIAGALAALGLAAVGALALVRNAFSVNRYGPATAVTVAAAGCAALASAALAHRVHRDPIAGLTLGVIATVFAAVAGLLAVPGAPGAAHVLLGSMAAAATAALAMRVTGYGTVALTATCGAAVIIAIAALAAVLTSAPTHVVGSLTALVCLVLVETAPRMSIRLAGLTPETDEADVAARALLAERWLTSLRTTFASAAAIGAAVAALTAHRAIALAAVTAGVLLLHARLDKRRHTLFAATGIASITTVFAITVTDVLHSGPWIVALTAALAAAAMHLGFGGPAISRPPVARRGASALGCLALTAMVPLTCWTCGAFGAVRGLIRA